MSNLPERILEATYNKSHLPRFSEILCEATKDCFTIMRLEKENQDAVKEAMSSPKPFLKAPEIDDRLSEIKNICNKYGIE